MADNPPTKEFGKRRPAPQPSGEPVKRSSHVLLLVMGTIAVGSAAFALVPRQNCDPPAPGAPASAQTNTACSGGHTSSGGSSGSRWYSRSSFYGGDSSSHASSGGSSDGGSGGVSRGGFGGFGHGFGGGGE